MNKIRVIPCLDVADGRVVKGVNFINLRDAGDPVELARAYVGQGADELVFLDVTATSEGRETTYEMVKKTAVNVTIPFTVGGGVRSVEDAQKMIASGANKVGVSSAAVANPELIHEIATAIGKESLVIAIDVKRNEITQSGYSVVTHGGKKDTGKDAIEWVKEVQDKGAGEILLTSLDSDGTQSGFDRLLLKKVTSTVKIPVIASGGAGELRHFVEAVESGASAVLAASVFHNGTFNVAEVKKALVDSGFEVL